MRGRNIYTPHIFYSAIDPGGAGGGAPGGQPGGTPTPSAQPGGQGAGQGGGFRDQFFPNVPDEVWGQVEPHVRNVQGHVTQLEQRYAPFKSYRDEDLQGLAQFSSAFDRDPVGQWIRMAQGLQQARILDPDLDLDHLSALVTGQLGNEEPGGQGQPQPDPQQQQNGDVPPWAQQLMQRIEQLEGGVNQFTTSHRQQVEDAVLQRQIGFMKEGLQKAGFPEDSVSQEQMLSAYIAHRGNVQAALESFTNMRNTLLKGFTQPKPGPNNQPAPGGNNDLDLPNGSPQPRVSRSQGRKSAILQGDTKAAALQYLQQQDQA